VGEHFQEVAVGAAEVDAVAGRVPADSARFAQCVVGPVVDVGGDETVDDAVELVETDSEGVVLNGDLLVPPGEEE
jgi:hypothetical protein